MVLTNTLYKQNFKMYMAPRTGVSGMTVFRTLNKVSFPPALNLSEFLS
jgi:hypothetical protein